MIFPSLPDPPEHELESVEPVDQIEIPAEISPSKIDPLLELIDKRGRRRRRAKTEPYGPTLGGVISRRIVTQLTKLLSAPDLTTKDKVKVAGYIIELKRSIEAGQQLPPIPTRPDKTVKGENWLARQK